MTTTVFDPTLSGSEAGWPGYTIVELIAAANLVAATGDQVRVTLSYVALGAGNTVQAYIGQQAASGDVYDFDSAVQLTFSGNGTITGDGSTLTYVSDFVTLPQAFDNSKTYLVASQFSAGGTVTTYSTAIASNHQYYRNTATDAGTLDKLSYNIDDPPGKTVDKIEIQASGGGSAGSLYMHRTQQRMN